jgi:hypothetical protein
VVVTVEMLSAVERIEIHDVTGRVVRVLANVGAASEIVWDGMILDGTRAPTGVYWMVGRSGEHATTRELTVIR